MAGLTFHGFDVGGQSVKAALVGGNAEVLARGRRETGLETTITSLAASIRELLEEIDPGGTPPAVGVGLPGVLGPDGRLAGSPNIPHLLGSAIEAELAAALGCKVRVENDANCAALAEGWCGAADGRDHYLAITLGTGLGSGLVANGALYHGETGFACELGHAIVERNGRLCGCGNRGCLEAYVSETALRAIVAGGSSGLREAVEARMASGEGCAQAVFTLARTNEPAAADAAKIATDAVDALGVGLASAVNVLDVQTIVIGGGIAPAIEMRLDELRAAMDAALFARSIEQVDVVMGKHGGDAGAIGAAALVR